MTRPPIVDEAIQRWQALDVLARRIITVASIVLLIAIVWAYVYAPLQASRVSNANRIAALSAQRTIMQRQAAEIAVLKTTPDIVATRSQANADVAGLQALFGAAANIKADTGGQFRIDVSQMQYADWLDRVNQALTKFSLRVVLFDLDRDTADTNNAGDTSERPRQRLRNVSGTLILANQASRGVQAVVPNPSPGK